MSATKHKITARKTALIQPRDSCGPKPDMQTITFETSNNGNGPHCVIRTERWSIETDKEIEFLVAAIRNAIKQEIYK